MKEDRRKESPVSRRDSRRRANEVHIVDTLAISFARPALEWVPDTHSNPMGSNRQY
jgi:hypothetical protein